MFNLKYNLTIIFAINFCFWMLLLRSQQLCFWVTLRRSWWRVAFSGWSCPEARPSAMAPRRTWMVDPRGAEKRCVWRPKVFWWTYYLSIPQFWSILYVTMIFSFLWRRCLAHLKIEDVELTEIWSNQSFLVLFKVEMAMWAPSSLLSWAEFLQSQHIEDFLVRNQKCSRCNCRSYKSFPLLLLAGIRWNYAEIVTS